MIQVNLTPVGDVLKGPFTADGKDGAYAGPLGFIQIRGLNAQADGIPLLFNLLLFVWQQMPPAELKFRPCGLVNLMPGRKPASIRLNQKLGLSMLAVILAGPIQTFPLER